MHIINRLLNLILGGNRPTTKYIPPSKERLIANMYREHGCRDWD
jgi:hypothetical protein